MRREVDRHTDLDVYRQAYRAAMRIFELTKEFPQDERFLLSGQMRRSSRSVCANLAEAWRKRRYEGAFVSKLSDCEAEAAETQTWVQFAVDCSYLSRELGAELYREYEGIIGRIVRMIQHPEQWAV